MLINELLKEDPDIVPKASHLIILHSKSAGCMASNGKNTKNNRQICRRVYFVRISEKCKMYKIEWCEGGLKLA